MRFGAVVFVEGFVEVREDDCVVACVFAGRVDDVAIPGAVGQAFWIQQIGFDFAQGCVQRVGISWRVLLLLCHVPGG